MMLFLVFGIAITVYQIQQIQKINSQAAVSNCTVPTAGLTTKAAEQTLLTDINNYRSQNNLGKLTLNSTLKQSSDWLSLDMAAHKKLSHVDSLNRTPDVRLSNCGYTISKGYGENIASGSTDPSAVFNAWKNDSSHNQLLLDPKYTITGISMELDSKGIAYWTMDLGAGQASTNSTITSAPSLPTSIPTDQPTNIPDISSAVSPSLSPSVSPSIDSDFPTPTTGPITVDMQIGVSVKINGIGRGGNTNPIHKTRRVVATIYDTTNQIATTGTAFLNYDGSNYFTGIIHLGKLSQGVYFVKLSSLNTLQVLVKPEFQNLKINHVNTIPAVTLYQGEMNGDNIIDIDDYNAVLPCFQSIPVCADATQIDFDDDGVTDVKDYNLLLNSFEILHGS